MEIVISYLSTWGSLTVAGLSFIVASVSLIKSIKAQKMQIKINELEYKIKKYELDKIDAEKANSNKACIEARIINISRDKYRMKIWNSGDLIARNIEVKTEDNAGLIFMGDMLPYEELDAKKSFEIPLIIYPGTSRKSYVITSWTEENGEVRENKQFVSL